MNQIANIRYSLLDPDFPLLAIDAAYEIEELITQAKENGFNPKSARLNFSNDLINRLKQIAQSDHMATADNELFCHSLMPQIESENIQLPSEPISLTDKLASVIESYDLKGSKNDLQSIRDFFIAVSDFSLNAQRWSRGNQYI